MGSAVHHRNAIADGRSSCHIVGARVCVASGATADQLAGSVAEVIATYIRMCVGVGDSVAASNAAPAGRSKTGDSSCGGCASADIRLARGHRPPGTGCTGAGSKAACVSAGRRTIETHSAARAGACNRGIGSRGCIGPRVGCSRCHTSQGSNRHDNQRLFHDHSFEQRVLRPPG